MPTYDIANRLKDYWQERVTGAPKFIDTDHAYVHEGIAYEAAIARDEALTTGRWVFKTPASDYVHFRPAFVSVAKGDVTCEIWEDTTSTGGTWSAVAAYNRKRTSTKTAASLIYTAATSTGGVKIDSWRLWGSTGSGGAGGGAQMGQPHEWVLKQGTEYRLAFDTTQAFSANLFWYEEGDA